MAKQEEIREGIEETLHASVSVLHDFSFHFIRRESREELADRILKYLHSQGVVIKVDRAVPDDRFHRDLRMAGYVAVEPLIKETEKPVV